MAQRENLKRSQNEKLAIYIERGANTRMTAHFSSDSSHTWLVFDQNRIKSEINNINISGKLPIFGNDIFINNRWFKKETTKEIKIFKQHK